MYLTYRFGLAKRLYVSYSVCMALKSAPRPSAKDSLTVRIGTWFEARATGEGVREVRIIALPVVVLLVLGGLALRLWGL